MKGNLVKKSKMMQESGITLIALVVTIIVLLLLAGVTISTLTGDNGILTQVQKASEKSKDAETLENIRLAYMASQIDRYVGNTDKVVETLQKSLEYVYGVGNVEVEPNGSGGYLIEIAGKGKYEINANGEVSKKEGIALSESNLELQIIDGTPQEAVTLTTEIEGLEGEEISWELIGSESDKAKITLTVAGDKKVATVQAAGATQGEVTIRVNCGAENSAECTVTVVSVVHVSSISNITPTGPITVDRETNTQTITATVNAGATERLIWTPSNDHILISDPDVNETNNTQTVTIQVLSKAVSGEQITVTAQNSAGNLTTNNTVTITVNVPVTGISIAPSTATTIAPGGTQNFTATVTPADATNKTINWTIVNPSVSGVVKYPNNSATGTSTSGTAIAVTAGANEGTAKIKATSAADSTKTIEVDVTVGEVLGYFKTEGGVARYYESESDTTGTPITSANMGEYLGRKVKYTPGNAGTNTSYGTSTDYRLFYVDVGTGTNGKYGDGQGTIYLKADCDTRNVNWSSYKEYDKGTSGDSSDSRATMFKLNPGMNNTKVDDYHDCGVAWMTDPAQWSAWKDGSIKLATDNTAGSGINYVVGGPSMEMYVDSYNAYLDAHTENNVVQIYKNGSTTDRAEKLDCEYVTSGYNAKGYRIGFKNTPKADWVNTGYYQANNSLFAYNSANGQQMYNPGSSRYYWLASPSALATNCVMYVYGYNGSVYCGSYDYSRAFCPLVSIKSGVGIEEKR